MNTSSTAAASLRRDAYLVARTRHQRWLTRLDAIGYRLRPGGRPMPAAAPVRSILLLRPEHLGDLITLLPALARARVLAPGAHLTLLLRPEYEEFMAAAGVADALWALPVPWSRRGAAANWRGLLRSGPWPRFDLAIDFHGDPRNLLLGRRCGRRLVGYGIRGGGFLLDQRVDFPVACHVVARQIDLVNAALQVEEGMGAPVEAAWRCPQQSGYPLPAIEATTPSDQRKRPESGVEVPPTGTLPRLALAPAWRTAAAPHLERLGDGRSGGFLIVHPGAGRTDKLWPEAAWRVLLEQRARRGETVALTGTAGEAPLCARLAAGLRGLHNFAGRTSLGALAGLAAAARRVIAPDTGLIHLAQALGTPTIALFRGESPQVWGYAHRPHRALTDTPPDRIPPALFGN